MQKENDTLLVAKLREGNKFAFEALYEKYSARLYNTIVLLAVSYTHLTLPTIA